MPETPHPDVIVAENTPFEADLDAADVLYLERILRGAFRIGRNTFVVLGTVGHVALPSGKTLRIRSTKAPAASVLAWSAYVDPRIGDLRMLGEVARSSQEGDVASLLATLFLAELGRVVGAHGVARAYQKTLTVSATVRGRVDFVRFARRAGDASRVPCEVWERRPRSAAMRMLAATLGRVSSDPVMRSASPLLLRSLRLAFADVPADVDPDLLAGRASVPRNEQGFEGALALARLVLRRIGLGEGEEDRGVSYLVGLDLLFERAVVRALDENGVEALPKHPLLHERIGLRGDAVPGGSRMELDAWCPALVAGGVVIDAKYKHAISSANLQQVLAYCALSGARVGVMVVPSGLVADRRTYRFRPVGSQPVAIHLIEFDVHGTDVPTWRAAGAAFAGRVAAACATPTSLAG